MFIVSTFPNHGHPPKKFKSKFFCYLYKFILELNPTILCEIKDSENTKCTNVFGGMDEIQTLRFLKEKK